jgi:hypothetical protein
VNGTHKLDPLDLMGVQEIALLAKVSSAAVANWCSRFPDFPQPVAVLAGGPVFNEAHVKAWLRKRASTGSDTMAESTTCFVIGPIGDELAPIGHPDRARYEEAIETWEKIIEPACIEVGLAPLRADKITKAGEVTEQVFKLIRDADVLIADVTGGNSNVMYELGLRHTVPKSTIQIGEYGKLPFDIAGVRTLKFSRTPAGLVDARKKLRELLAVALEGGSDPVTATRLWGPQAVEEGSGPPIADQPRPSNEAEEPGVFELLAEMEEAFPEISGLAARSTQAMKEMTALAESGVAEARKDDVVRAGFAGRLRLANKMAAQLSPIADELEAVADGFEKQVARIDSGMTCLLDLVEQDPSQLKDMGLFADTIRELVSNVHQASEAQKGLTASLAGQGKFSKPMRISTRRIVDATRRGTKALERAEVWNARLQQIIRRTEGGDKTTSV